MGKLAKRVGHSILCRCNVQGMLATLSYGLSHSVCSKHIQQRQYPHRRGHAEFSASCRGAFVLKEMIELAFVDYGWTGHCTGASVMLHSRCGGIAGLRIYCCNAR